MYLHTCTHTHNHTHTNTHTQEVAVLKIDYHPATCLALPKTRKSPPTFPHVIPLFPQKTYIFAKAPYICANKDANDGFVYVHTIKHHQEQVRKLEFCKRFLYILQKGPIYSAKEAYIFRKRALYLIKQVLLCF